MSSIRHCHSEGVECIEVIHENPWQAWDALGCWNMDHPEVKIWSAHLTYAMDTNDYVVTAYVTDLDMDKPVDAKPTQGV